jgi:site-specific DNA-methyltransferase (adenine-specific)
VSFIEFPNEGKTVHPTQKPVALFEYLINTYTSEGNLVLDNCLGSGTTAIAAQNLNRKWIGIEKEEKYCQIARERIEALTAKE